ncbi:RND efflux system, membrane fusion protein CmeA [Candidatus Burkholderia humilis]|nr:RND efflux system, membrane fusion protein CmeA [Candidatus Burkholderia humilis]
MTAAKLDLQFTEIRSPINGRAGRALLTIGNLAVANQGMLVTVVSDDLLYVDFDLDEQTYLKLISGRSGSTGNGSYSISVGVGGDESFPYAGVVDFFDNVVDPSTGTIHVRARLQNPQHILKPGLYARVRFGSAEDTNTILD